MSLRLALQNCLSCGTIFAVKFGSLQGESAQRDQLSERSSVIPESSYKIMGWMLTRM